MQSRGYRAVSIALAGMILSAGAIWMSQTMSGSVAAIALLVGATSLPLTLGVAISLALDRNSQDYAALATGRRSLRQRLRGTSLADLTRCTGCGRQRDLSNTVLVCRRCDLSPAMN